MPKPALTFRRLVGLDRSGGPPPQTRRGEALHPWTLPNAIGFTRLALVPVFLVLALDSGDGRNTAATLLFAFVAASDFLDGLLARITGQYSRLGALLDPLTDRLVVIAGAIVAWEFELLPRWALLVLAAREALMLLPETEHWARSSSGLALGYALMVLGQTSEAVAVYAPSAAPTATSTTTARQSSPDTKPPAPSCRPGTAPPHPSAPAAPSS